MQKYTEMKETDIIKDTWYYIRDNDKTIRSSNSGNNRPANVMPGCLWFDTRAGNNGGQVLKILTGTDGTQVPSSPVWKVVADLNVDNMTNLVDRGALASSFNFNNYKNNGVYKVAIPDVNVWNDIGTKPATNMNAGLFTVFASGNNVVQLYTRTNATNPEVYLRTAQDGAFKSWARVWTNKTLTSLSQLTNNGNGSNGSKYALMSDITKDFILGRIAYTPVDSVRICSGGNTVPTWQSDAAEQIAPVINGLGIVHIGRYIKFHPTSGSTNVTITLDAGTNYSTGRMLKVYGNAEGDAASILASNDVIGFSDERLKTNIKTIENAVEKVKQIRGVTFKRRDIPKTAPRQTGVIAQDVQKVLPEAVRAVAKTEGGVEYLTVAYGNLVGLLIEAIKEQQETIEKLVEKCGLAPEAKPVKKTARKRTAKTVKKES